MIAELERTGLEAEFVEAIDGASLSEEELAELCDMDVVRKHPSWLSKGMIGCVLSHRKAMGLFLQSDYSHILILEDDVSLSNGLRSFLSGLRGSHIRDDEALLLHYSSFEEIVLTADPESEAIANHSICKPENPFALGSAAGYILSKNAAGSLHDWVLPVRTASDSWGEFLKSGAIASLRCVHPMPVSVVGAKSTISITSQSRLRGALTEWLDNRQIPVISSVFRMLRLRSIASRTRVRVVKQ
jgi:GR25 family glycosyltransferase involved in LPS biosynthesis